jgi:hypothetical protein
MKLHNGQAAFDAASGGQHGLRSADWCRLGRDWHSERGAVGDFCRVAPLCAISRIVIAAGFPLALAIAVDPGWTLLLWTIALFVAVGVIVANFVEPWVYGSGAGLSPVALIVAAVCWTWLWGPIGLLLSTPLTACLVVLGTSAPHGLAISCSAFDAACRARAS